MGGALVNDVTRFHHIARSKGFQKQADRKAMQEEFEAYNRDWDPEMRQGLTDRAIKNNEQIQLGS